jgi:DNA topoisomerase-1
VSDPDEEDEARLLRAIDVAAEKLGNTRAVCRSSYVHPVIPEAFFDGRLTDAWRRSRRGRWLTRAESAVNRLVGARSQ